MSKESFQATTDAALTRVQAQGNVDQENLARVTVALKELGDSSAGFNLGKIGERSNILQSDLLAIAILDSVQELAERQGAGKPATNSQVQDIVTRNIRDMNKERLSKPTFEDALEVPKVLAAGSSLSAA